MIYISFRFEDGHQSHYTHGFEILKKYNMVGSFYMATNKIGKSNAWPDQNMPYINYDQLIEMQDEGNEIGSHSKSHSRDWLKKNKEIINDEICGSLDELKSKNLNVKTFCFPFTDTSTEAIKLVNENYEAYLAEYSHNRIIKGSIRNKHIPSLSIKGGFSNLIENIIKPTSDEDEWLVITFHEIINNPSEVGIFPEDFDLIMSIINDCVNTGTHKVVTIYDGYQIFK